MAAELGITARRVWQLYGDYLEACATGREASWVPGKSGGNRTKGIPAEVEELWRRMLEVRPPAAYGFAASEALRRQGFTADRATVRRWAFRKGLAHAKTKPTRKEKSNFRWQCQQIGMLWQLDMTPHHWFSGSEGNLPLFDLIDDCSRVVTGTRLYPRECLLAYLDFLPLAFEAYGLPQALYVDYHSFFFSQVPETLTYLGDALRFYDVTFKYAPTPQAKGKVERQHQFWQKRLPTYFALESIRDIDTANRHIDQLRLHHNQEELHREIQMTPDKAWRLACRQKRSVVRPKPPCPWWRYIWSVRCPMKVNMDGTVPAGIHRVKINRPPFSRLIRCEHPDGSYTFLANAPGSGGKPIVLLRIESQSPSWQV